MLVSSVIVLLAGCNEQPGKTSENSEATSNLTQSGYPIVNDPITLRLMGAKAAIQGPWENLALFKETEKLTNIKIEFNTPPEESWEEKKNLAFASGDLPDFFFRGNLTANDISIYGSQGILIPLEDLINQYAPNISKMFKDHPDVKAAMTATDGHIYTLYHVAPYDSRSLYGGFGRMWMSPDLKAELGLEKLPSTTEDFYTLLKTLSDKGKIPLSAGNYNLLSGTFKAAFGMVMDGSGIEIVNDKARFVPIEDNYKAYLTYMNRLYSEKLLDNQIFSHTNQEFQAKGRKGQLGVYAGYNMHGVLGMSIDDVLKKGAPMFSPLTSPVSQNPVWSAQSSVDKSYAFAITNKNSNPEATIRWVDFFYSTRGALLAQNGVMKDEAFFKDANQKFSFTDYLTPEQRANQAEYVGKNLTIYNSPRYLDKGYYDHTIEETHVTFYNKLIEEKLVSKYTKEAVPQLSFTPDEQKKLNNLLTDIRTYMQEMEAKFIVGQELLTKWDSYVSTMKKMKVDEVVNIYQTAYDRYNKAIGK
jgi:putative aldouronate transport system substrate-binding protein